MIKHIIFDLDGVLVSTKDIHYKALNESLPNKFKISLEDHYLFYDGLPTKKKLEILSKKKNLEKKTYNEIIKNKDYITKKIISRKIKKNIKLINIFKKLKDRNIKISCASNAKRYFVDICLKKIGIIQYFDNIFSNEDINYPKPHFEIYFKCMIQSNVGPKNTLIIEDSSIGRQGASNSGGHLLEINQPADLTFDLIQKRLSSYKNSSFNVPWIDKKLNVLIPMAGEGNRFKEAGYTFPKPLIEINNKPMIQIVAENLNIDANYIFIVRKEHYMKYNLKTLLKLIKPTSKIIIVDKLTEGAACTTLLAKKYINNKNPLLIANSDQFIEWNSNEVLYNFNQKGVDAGILTFESTHPKWSYAKINSKGLVTKVAEKKPISNNATVGIYYWSSGKKYVQSAETMIKKNIRVNNEFYVCPVFNELIIKKGKIKISKIKKMWGLGTPEDLNYFLNNYNGRL